MSVPGGGPDVKIKIKPNSDGDQVQGLGQVPLGPLPIPLPIKSEMKMKKVSKNCRNFTRLFHCSFDEDSTSTDSSNSNDVKLKIEPGSITKQEQMQNDLIKTQAQSAQESFDIGIDVKNEPKTPDPEATEEEIESKSPMPIDDNFNESEESAEDLRNHRKKNHDKLEHVQPDPDENSDIDVDDDEEIPPQKRKSSRKTTQRVSNFLQTKTHEALIMKRLTKILKQDPSKISPEENEIISSFPTLARIVKKRLETRLLASERLKEWEDRPDILETKCEELARSISTAKHLIIYTGAGISTSASIPDYRGPNGIWTLLRNGQSLDSNDPFVLTTADPTATHMSITKLYELGMVKHIVSQNCDGLHLRSGIPKNALSEVHGNMYIEGCIKCGREYVRLFDVTENTRRHEHRTGRRCYYCGTQLRDTVIHFGERGAWRFPLNWQGAEYAANHADVILCLGSSLKVLRRYPWLWCMDQPANKRPKLIIVNLQWTPKDPFAALKIHGKCDQVMSRVMSLLSLPIPTYSRALDPIFGIATPLHPSEIHLKSSRELTFPPDQPFPAKLQDLNNYIQFEPKFHVVIHSSASETESHSGSDEESEENDDSPESKNKNPQKLKLRSSSTKKINAKSNQKNPLKVKENKGESDKKLRKKNKSIIKKGNGVGWLGNAWGRGIKPKKRKLK